MGYIVNASSKSSIRLGICEIKRVALVVSEVKLNGLQFFGGRHLDPSIGFGLYFDYNLAPFQGISRGIFYQVYYWR